MIEVVIWALMSITVGHGQKIYTIEHFKSQEKCEEFKASLQKDLSESYIKLRCTRGEFYMKRP